MNLQFTNEKGDSVSLGTYSFEFLNKRNVFDKHNLDNEFRSKIIIKLDGTGCKEVARIIKEVLDIEKPRKYLLDKILNLITFLEISKGCEAVIV